MALKGRHQANSMWSAGEIIARLDDVVPLVAQWEKSSHPAQVRLHSYLDDIAAKLPLPTGSAPLFLHLHVCAKNETTLLQQNDIENFLTPLFGRRWLDPRRFDLVIGTKDALTPSYLTLGIAKPLTERFIESEWSQFSAEPIGSASSKKWKEHLRQSLAVESRPLPPCGGVRCQISLRCSGRRNWTTLWKPVVDAMGPVLGYIDPLKPYHPRDDRITHLELHRIVDESLQWRVQVLYSWRMAQAEFD
jgi:hypothetical protein